MLSGKTCLIKKLSDELVFTYSQDLEKDFENHKGIKRDKFNAHPFGVKNLLAGYSIRLLRKRDKLQ